MWILLALVFLGGFVLWLAAGSKHEQMVVQEKANLRERAARDAFIQTPTDSSRWLTLIVDNVSKNAVVHDRAELRRGLEVLALPQIRAYQDYAHEETMKWWIREVGANPNRNLDLRITDVEAGLRRHFDDGAMLDPIAEQTGETFDDGPGMRRALAESGIDDMRRMWTPEADDLDWVQTHEEDLSIWPCSTCGLMWRDLRLATCRGCGHAFPGPTKLETRVNDRKEVGPNLPSSPDANAITEVLVTRVAARQAADDRASPRTPVTLPVSDGAGRNQACPACLTASPLDAIFCKRCGTKLIVSATRQEEPRSPSSGSTCASCGTASPADAVFCKRCGQKLSAAALPAPAPQRSAQTCPACGLVNPSTALRCDCGHSFSPASGAA